MRKLFYLTAVAVMIAATLMVGCKKDKDDGPPTYTVWTDVTTYSEFYSVFQTTLNNGYYIRLDLSDAQWNQIAPSLTNEDKYNWTEDQLYNYFIGRGFGQDEANQQKAWLLTIKHGFIASRTGETVYLLLK